MGLFPLHIMYSWLKTKPSCPRCGVLWKEYGHKCCGNFRADHKLIWKINEQSEILYDGASLYQDDHDGDIFLVNYEPYSKKLIMKIRNEVYSVEKFIIFCQEFEKNSLFL